MRQPVVDRVDGRRVAGAAAIVLALSLVALAMAVFLVEVASDMGPRAAPGEFPIEELAFRAEIRPALFVRSIEPQDQEPGKVKPAGRWM